jgi:hypothetical protein
MGPGLLVALTLPGLVLLLVVLAAAEAGAARVRRRSPLHGAPRRALSAGGLDVLSAALDPGREADREERRVSVLLREDDGDAAPPRSRVDLDRGLAVLVLPADAGPAR